MTHSYYLATSLIHVTIHNGHFRNTIEHKAFSIRTILSRLVSTVLLVNTPWLVDHLDGFHLLLAKCQFRGLNHHYLLALPFGFNPGRISLQLITTRLVEGHCDGFIKKGYSSIWPRPGYITGFNPFPSPSPLHIPPLGYRP